MRAYLIKQYNDYGPFYVSAYESLADAKKQLKAIKNSKTEIVPINKQGLHDLWLEGWGITVWPSSKKTQAEKK